MCGGQQVEPAKGSGGGVTLQTWPTPTRKTNRGVTRSMWGGQQAEPLKGVWRRSHTSNLTDLNSSPGKYLPDLHQSQEHPLAKVDMSTLVHAPRVDIPLDGSRLFYVFRSPHGDKYNEISRYKRIYSLLSVSWCLLFLSSSTSSLA